MGGGGDINKNLQEAFMCELFQKWSCILLSIYFKFHNLFRKNLFGGIIFCLLCGLGDTSPLPPSGTNTQLLNLRCVESLGRTYFLQQVSNR